MRTWSKLTVTPSNETITRCLFKAESELVLIRNLQKKRKKKKRKKLTKAATEAEIQGGIYEICCAERWAMAAAWGRWAEESPSRLERPRVSECSVYDLVRLCCAPCFYTQRFYPPLNFINVLTELHESVPSDASDPTKERSAERSRCCSPVFLEESSRGKKTVVSSLSTSWCCIHIYINEVFFFFFRFFSKMD